MKTFRTIAVFCIIQTCVTLAAGVLFLLPAAPCLLLFRAKESFGTFENVAIAISYVLICFLLAMIISFINEVISKVEKEIRILKSWIREARETNVSLSKKDKGPTQF